MLSVYWFCFVLGGIFVLLAVLGGLDGADFDIHFDTDFDVHIDSDIELTDPGDRPAEPTIPRQRRRHHPWRFLVGMLKSLKFWTFGICFFGLTGLVLSQLPLSPLLVAIGAISMGLLCGALVAGILQALRRRQVDSLVRSSDLVGLPGTVELPFNATNRGKVRLLVKGTLLNFTAYTDEAKEFNVGDQILVVGTEQNRLWVVSADSLNKATPPRQQPPATAQEADSESLPG